MRRETAALYFFIQCTQGVPRVRECGNCGAYLGQHVIRYGAECFRRVGNVGGKKPKHLGIIRRIAHFICTFE